MVNLITSEENKDLLGEYSEKLVELIPEVTTVVNNINLKKAMTAFGDYEKVFYGDGNIYEHLGKNKFRISANSFFQTNTKQAERLYDTAVEFAEFNKDDVVFDLYSGAGSIAIYISDLVKEVYGFETAKSAIKDAKLNSESNGIKNVHFLTADLNRSFSYLLGEKSLPQPNVIIADPPRGGMNPRTVRDCLRLQPAKIVYISCNPATQARDIQLLVEGGYNLVKMRPVDMFPHTFHIENVALLNKLQGNEN